MNFRTINTPGFLSALLVAAALVGGSSFARIADAAAGPGMGGGMHPGMHGGGMQGRGMQGKGMHGKGMQGGCKHGKGKHGAGRGKQGKGESAGHLLGAGWKQTLSDEQKARLDRLHVNFAKAKAPLKARMKALKVDLAVLATNPQPNKAAIDAKIGELMRLKGEMLGAKYGHVAAQRQVLTPAQQASFDMETIHDAMHGKKGEVGHGGKH